MIVCVCKAVSDRTIRQAAEQGVVSLRELSRLHGVGTCCGKCIPTARELLREAQQQSSNCSVVLQTETRAAA